MSGFIGWMEKWLESSPQGWSDMHLRIGRVPVIKTSGMQLVRAEGAPTIDAADLDAVIKRTVTWSEAVDIDRGADIGKTRFRVNGYCARAVGGIVLRKLGTEPPALDSIGLPSDVLRKAASAAQGLIVVAGETGSGKTTTLAALMADRAQSRSSTTITIEDPVEIIHPTDIQSADGGLSIFIQREVGVDTESFATGLRAALREAPDVIAVGEIRDRESAQLALQGAETGHLVLATLHTRSAAETVARLLAFFPTDEHPLVRAQLATGLRLVMRQVLLPAKDGSGRIPACEIMTLDGGIPAAIRDAKEQQILNEIRQGREYGMVALNEMLSRLVREGRVDAEEAMRHSNDTKELADQL